MKRLLNVIVCGLVMATTALANTNDVWALSVGGLGWSETTEGDNNKTDYDVGVYVSLGYVFELGLPAEAGIRQGIALTDSDTWFATSPYIDLTVYTVKAINLDLFAGGNAAIAYGDMSPEWTLSPEAGLRWWLKDDVAVLFRVEAPFNVDGWDYANELRYFLGFQVKL